MNFDNIPIDILKIINSYVNKKLIRDYEYVHKLCLVCDKQYRFKMFKEKFYFLRGSIIGICDKCVYKFFKII